MTTSKTLRLKKPLSFMQQARLAQVLKPQFSKEQSKEEIADNINNENKKSGTDHLKGKEEKVSIDDSIDKRARAHLKRKALFEAIDWLCVTYPNCFSREAPKPLKVGIFNDILLEGNWPYSKTFLRKTLGFYTGAPTYQQAIIQLTLRYSLSGEISQEIADFEKENAIKKRHAWEERRKEKKERTLNNRQKNNLED